MSDNVVEFTRVKCGNLTEIPPDLPPGAWLAKASVKKMATSKDKYPMLCVEWKTIEAYTDGNDNAVGQKASDFIVFWPENAPARKMTLQRLKTMCDALQIEAPQVTTIDSWDDLQEFIDSLEGLKARIWTRLEKRKDTGEEMTKIEYTAPKTVAKAKSKLADDDEDDAPAPPVKKKKKVTA